MVINHSLLNESGSISGSSGDEFLMIQNFETGEQAVIHKKSSRYKKSAMGFLNALKFKPYFLKHIVLTQAKEVYKPNHLNYFMSAMRRYYKELLYIWTVEVQEERLLKYGETVLHWHIIMGFPYDTDFGEDDIKRIQRYWKYGQVEIIPVRRPSMSYLMKYINKSLNTYLLGDYVVRRIGSSLIPQWFKQSMKRIFNAIEFFQKQGVTIDSFNEFYWQNGNAYLKTEDSFEIGGMIHKFMRKICVYHRKRSEWFKVSLLCGEPF